MTGDFEYQSWKVHEMGQGGIEDGMSTYDEDFCKFPIRTVAEYRPQNSKPAIIFLMF